MANIKSVTVVIFCTTAAIDVHGLVQKCEYFLATYGHTKQKKKEKNVLITLMWVPIFKLMHGLYGLVVQDLVKLLQCKDSLILFLDMFLFYFHI